MGEYTVKDLYSYGGFILGTCVTYALLDEAGVEGQWGKLIPAVLAGILFGYIGDRMYDDSKRTKMQ